MGVKKNLMTKEGYEKLLKMKEEILRKVETAWAKVGEAAGPEGDWHDNAAYDQARAEYDLWTQRLNEIKAQLINVELIESSLSNDTVEIGSTVTLSIEGDQETYQILGEADSDPLKGRISYKSPIAQAVLGLKKGEATTVKIPAGTLQIKVLKIKS